MRHRHGDQPTLSKLSTMAFLFCHRLFRRKQQHNASFPGAVSSVFLCCPHHNSRQAVVFAAHPWKTLWLWELWQKYCYRKWCDYCSPPKSCIFSFLHLCLKTGRDFRVSPTYSLQPQAKCQVDGQQSGLYSPQFQVQWLTVVFGFL